VGKITVLKMLSKLKRRFEIIIPEYLCTRTGEGMPSLDGGMESHYKRYSIGKVAVLKTLV